MPLDMQRMSRLGLQALLEKPYPNAQAFQVAMAKKLRELTFQYLRGELRGQIADGPAVETLRTQLDLIGGMNQFIGSQSSNYAWATSLELTILAELVGANFAVTMTNDGRNPTVLSADPDANKATVLLHCKDNTHWSATVDGALQRTRADGNCGYNAFALSMASLMPQRPNIAAQTASEQTAFLASQIMQQESTYLQAALSEAQEAARAWRKAMDSLLSTERAPIEKQIRGDYEIALKLYLQDLPDEDGHSAISVDHLASLCRDPKYLRPFTPDQDTDENAAGASQSPR